MNKIVLPLALLSVVAVAAPASAELRNFEIQMMTSDMQNAANAKIKRAFDLAARQRGAQEIEISCSPASSDWCAKNFVQACDNAKGGMSTDPDGGVTCSLPQYK